MDALVYLWVIFILFIVIAGAAWLRKHTTGNVYREKQFREAIKEGEEEFINMMQAKKEEKPTFSLVVVRTILATATGKGPGEEIPYAYPLPFIKAFARMAFQMGTIVGKLEPRKVETIIAETASFGTPHIGVLRGVVLQIQNFAEKSGVNTSDSYVAWVDDENADALKLGKTTLDLEQTFKIGLLCFQYGCIFGVNNPDSVKSMYNTDRKAMPDGQLTEGPSWQASVEAARGWLKQYGREGFK